MRTKLGVIVAMLGSVAALAVTVGSIGVGPAGGAGDADQRTPPRWFEARLTRLAQDLGPVLGAQDAGIWFDDRHRLQIGFGPALQQPGSRIAARVRTLVRKAHMQRYVDVVPVRWTWRELVDAQAQLDERVMALFRAAMLQTNPDPAANAVHVLVASNLADADRATLDAAVAASPATVEVEQGGPGGIVVREVDVGWRLRRISADGRVLLLRSRSGGCGHDDGRAIVRERPERVVIRVRQHETVSNEFLACTSDLRLLPLRVRLARPLGDRSLLHG